MPNLDLGQLSSLLQQFNAGLSSFLSTLIIDPATLQLLFSLIPQLIKSSPGATGPTGPVIGAGYFYSYGSTFQSQVPAGSSGFIAPLEQPPTLVGNGLALANGNTIQIIDPGLYLIDYTVSGDPAGGPEHIGFQLLLNNTPVAGSATVQTMATGLFDEATWSHSMLLNITQANATLQIQYFSDGSNLTFEWIAPNRVYFSVNMIRLM